jgi:hypothetical protein
MGLSSSRFERLYLFLALQKAHRQTFFRLVCRWDVCNCLKLSGESEAQQDRYYHPSVVPVTSTTRRLVLVCLYVCLCRHFVQSPSFQDVMQLLAGQPGYLATYMDMVAFFERRYDHCKVILMRTLQVSVEQLAHLQLNHTAHDACKACWQICLRRWGRAGRRTKHFQINSVRLVCRDKGASCSAWHSPLGGLNHEPS